MSYQAFIGHHSFFQNFKMADALNIATQQTYYEEILDIMDIKRLFCHGFNLSLLFSLSH